MLDNVPGQRSGLNAEVQMALEQMAPGTRTRLPGNEGPLPTAAPEPLPPGGDEAAFLSWLQKNRLLNNQGSPRTPATATGDAIAPLTPQQALNNQAPKL